MCCDKAAMDEERFLFLRNLSILQTSLPTFRGHTEPLMLCLSTTEYLSIAITLCGVGVLPCAA